MEGIRVENFHPGAMTVGMIAGILEELYGYYERMCQISGQRAKRMAGSGNGLRRNALMQQLAEGIFGGLSGGGGMRSGILFIWNP